MKLFSCFKREGKLYSSNNGVSGPKYLEQYSEHFESPHKILTNEWRRKLISNSGNSRFKIKYYGKRHDEYPSLIVSENFSPLKISVVDILTDDEILLFDGSIHGYNALFCDKYTLEQLNKRTESEIYVSDENQDTFEVIISTIHSINYNEEFIDEVEWIYDINQWR
ncbi:hypothetical protein [Sediminitomix flava]|uniref:Uncharacterized protein n=1 Tax=Sediminitomix flava TaxID=379075 RepID=A0A315YRR1_SEDFL|nr:hypothetical protein [Sediminitomix flava]PWJ31143.1 hypothetical protein BC781_1253 [Sediminitomix flava]